MLRSAVPGAKCASNSSSSVVSTLSAVFNVESRSSAHNENAIRATVRRIASRPQIAWDFTDPLISNWR